MPTVAKKIDLEPLRQEFELQLWRELQDRYGGDVEVCVVFTVKAGAEGYRFGNGDGPITAVASSGLP